MYWAKDGKVIPIKGTNNIVLPDGTKLTNLPKDKLTQVKNNLYELGETSGTKADETFYRVQQTLTLDTNDQVIKRVIVNNKIDTDGIAKECQALKDKAVSAAKVTIENERMSMLTVGHGKMLEYNEKKREVERYKVDGYKKDSFPIAEAECVSWGITPTEMLEKYMKVSDEYTAHAIKMAVKEADLVNKINSLKDSVDIKEDISKLMNDAFPTPE